MGEDCETFHPQRESDWQSPNWLSLSGRPTLGFQNLSPPCMNPSANMVSVSETYPVHALNVVPRPQTGQASEPPHGWFYCLPRFRQGFTPASRLTLKEKHPANHHGTYEEAVLPNAWSGSVQKRFLVFDQSGDQTTLMFCPGIGTSSLSLWGPKPQGVSNFLGEVPRSTSELNHNSGPILMDEFDEIQETDDQSEMHEDTEELNALLYSDDESDYSEEGEPTITSHSHSAVIAQYKPNWFESSTEEIASCVGPTKKRKLSDDHFDDMLAVMDTASSLNPNNRSFDNEDDAESGCANAWNAELGPIGSVSRNKRMRKERVIETVSMLESIIPDVKGKAALAVIDEAIHYLKSLKLKAQALGLGAI